MLHANEAMLLWLVAQAAVTDLAVRRIPNVLVLAGLCLALAWQLWTAAPAAAVLLWLGGAGAGLALFLPFYLLRGMAAGDVKLLAMVGAFLGPQAVLEVAVYSALVGGGMALALLQLARWRGTVALALPYGVAIGVGTAAVVFLAHR
jgi:Flp pilus assembly protein protease CpaA